MYLKNRVLCLLTMFLLGWINNSFISSEIKDDLKVEFSDSCFIAGIKCPTACVYNEPMENSTVVDSLDGTEAFIAYDQNDSCFFYVKRVRPVEMFTDSGYVRSYKTIYGYVKQSELVRKTDEELLNIPEYVATNRCKKGFIEDIDGFTNIRKERSVNSEIIGRILEKEDFWYWVLPSGNWHIVQTGTGIRGFVYKDRVKENKPQFRNYKVKL